MGRPRARFVTRAAGPADYSGTFLAVEHPCLVRPANFIAGVVTLLWGLILPPSYLGHRSF